MTQDLTDNTEASVLVVDDTRANLRLLSEILAGEGYHVRPAPNGQRALSAARTNPPDLILLDIMMPEMDGYEVCDQLKADPLTSEIPVIFISAMSEVLDKVRAFSVGGVDYITKPFQAEEVLARVNTHLTLWQLQRRLQEKNTRLQDEIEKRREAEEALREKNGDLANTLQMLKNTQNQLVESEKMAALGGLVAGVAHEINTPIGVGVTAASTLSNKTDALMEIYKSGKLKGSDLKTYLNNACRGSRLILNNLSRAQELVESFKQVAVDQTHLERRTFGVSAYIRKTLTSLMPKLRQTPHHISVSGDEELTIRSYPGAFSQVITNLVMNSVTHAYPEGAEGRLRFDFRQADGHLLLEYSDDGCGIPPENMGKIFDPFFTTARSEGGTGLGLHIVYNLVVRTLQGSVRCDSKVGEGTKFIIQLPPEV